MRLGPAVVQVSIPAENPSLCWTKIPPPSGGEGLQLSVGWKKTKPNGEKEAGDAEEQPAKE